MGRQSSFFAALGRVVLVTALAVTLLFTTACNNGDIRGARPNNPPVQMGGNNNPHKMGGDGYTNYKASTTAPEVKGSGKLRSSVERLPSGQLIADRNVKSDAKDQLIYPNSDAQSSNRSDIGPKGAALKPEPIPARQQTVIDRSDPDEKILEKVGKQFKDASGFIRDSVDSAKEKGDLDD